MDQAEVLQYWLGQAYKAGMLTVRLERTLVERRTSLSRAIAVLDQVLEQISLLEAAPSLPRDE